ncbi:MAG: DUF3667 domain-containing protein [Bacteroidales bacterium]|nr:DUF3667 domain-containing protein [Bacteroidales bacterium]
MEDKKMTKCLNCGKEFEGKFCPECGQRADTSRFTIKFIFQNLLLAILSNDGGVWITLKSLFTRPGQMMVDIINGKRKSYFSPFPMLFLTLSLYVVIFTFTGSNKKNFDGLSDDAEVEMIQEQKVESNSYTDIEYDLDDETSENIEKTLKWCLRFYDNHYTIIFILTIPFYIFSARVCFGRKNRKKYNRGEYCIPIVYSLIMVVLYQCLTSVAFYFSKSLYDTMDDLNIVVSIIAFAACFNKMMEFSVGKTVWRSILMNVFYIMILVVLTIIAIFLYAIIIAS